MENSTDQMAGRAMSASNQAGALNTPHVQPHEDLWSAVQGLYTVVEHLENLTAKLNGEDVAIVGAQAENAKSPQITYRQVMAESPSTIRDIMASVHDRIQHIEDVIF